MKEQPRLSEMIKNAAFDGFLLVRASSQRTASNGSKYLDMTLTDISGDVNAKMWDGQTNPPPVGKVIRLRGVMQEYNGRAQLRIDKMRESNEDDDIDMQKLIPCAPRPSDEMLDEILNRADAIRDKELKALVLMRLEEAGERLTYAPAAVKLHHAERSGLLHHTSTMLKGAHMISQLYPFLDADLLAAGVILHDLCKIDEMKSDELGMASDYTREGNLLGHLVLGVSELARCAKEIGVRKELVTMLQHMILSHHDLPEYGSPKPPMFPEAEALHTLDVLDARMNEMQTELAKVSPGAFTERIWSLDRKLYRREESISE
ncbi:MAG: HD domain-containing protein [Clostridia bacterium]|nr:HD domain-containing protein [Clostridia bacterium]